MGMGKPKTKWRLSSHFGLSFQAFTRMERWNRQWHLLNSAIVGLGLRFKFASSCLAAEFLKSGAQWIQGLFLEC